MTEAEKLIEECQKIIAEVKSLRDVLINMIKNHEENLSDIAGKMDQNLQHMEFTSENGRRVAIAECRKWSDFRRLSMSASLVAYEMDMWNMFSISSECRDFIFRYSESLPVSQNDVIPKNSICHKVLNLNPLSIRRWLSMELRVSKDKIIEGNLVSLSEYAHEHRNMAKRDNTLLEYYSNI